MAHAPPWRGIRRRRREADELLIFLRAAIRGDIGPRSEKLVEYGITPLRKRGRKAKPVAEPETPAVKL